jgi:polyisoprenoid-binding protein YceI
MRINNLLLLFFAVVIYSMPSYANWQLSNQDSTLNFISTKNQHLSEGHQFLRLSGTLNKAGKLDVVVDLASVETGIPIRNQRMQEFLFEVKSTPQATITTQVPDAILKMKSGETSSMTLQSVISIKGVSANYPVQVRITKTHDGSFVATSTQPILVQAHKHGLVSGIEKLQALASLSSIGFTVPVTFSVVFNQR